jgi:hypothetical protein
MTEQDELDRTAEEYKIKKGVLNGNSINRINR